MNREQQHPILRRLLRRYLLGRWVETFLIAGSVSLLAGTIGHVGMVSSTAIMAFAFIAALVLTVRYLRLLSTSAYELTAYLNERYPEFKGGADLLIRNSSELTSLQQLQQKQSLHQLTQLYPVIRFRHRIVYATLAFALSGVVFGTVQLTPHVDAQLNSTAATDDGKAVPDSIAAALSSVSIHIYPPAYTGISSYETKVLDQEFPEGSLLKWNIGLTKPVTTASLILDGRDTLQMSQSGKGYQISKQITTSGFCQFQWHDTTGKHQSGFYELNATEDRPPKLTIDNLPQFTRLTINDPKQIILQASMTDDYGIAKADVVATVSKGTGESVKFREEKMSFTSPATIAGMSTRASLTFDLIRMGLEPGDELYFYVQALDNKPSPNYARTETYFISLQDTSQLIATADAGLGVDLMPEYFRSQRQIIIDTEKLLRDRKSISRQVFNSTSNELGYDQKVLRLRYGQFLGEEADSGIGLETAVPNEHDEDKEEDPAKKYGHTHDKDNEHNLVDNKKSHDHGTDPTDPKAQDDPMKAFLHTHDNEEEATFFIQSIKAKLKAALTLMWDAELQLRLYEPAKSLPYQYKILNLLKEISNDSRIYVHRTGFDPPPLKEEKRLSGDLAEVKNSTNPFVPSPHKALSSITDALRLTEELIDSGDSSLTTGQQQTIRKAGVEMAALALIEPGRYIRSLSLIKQVSEETKTTMAGLVSLRQCLWSALPNQAATPGAQTIQQHRLDRRLLQKLAQQHE